MKKERLYKMIIGALFIALTCVATMIIRIPTIGTNGYVNIGDTMIIVNAWMFGGVYGVLAGGLGSALADILAGYTYYAPGTFVIKALMVLVAFIMFKIMSKTKSPKVVNSIIAGILAEIVMIVGYLAYEAIILGYGAVAFGSVVSNAFQGITNIVLSVILIFALSKTKIKRLM